jgi:hypothetical protein
MTQDSIMLSDYNHENNQPMLTSNYQSKSRRNRQEQGQMLKTFIASDYFSTKGRFKGVFQSPRADYMRSLMDKSNDSRLAEVLDKIKDPNTKQHFFEKVLIRPSIKQESSQVNLD